VWLPRDKKFHPKNIVDDKDSQPVFRSVDVVILAIGSQPSFTIAKLPGIFYAGDMVNGPTSVVEATAAGKNAALEADAFVAGTKPPEIPKKTKSRVGLAGKKSIPVPLDAEFFGRKILSPFLLSASPMSDGYAQMKKAYEAGWAGGVMKTTFDNVPIHIPAEYMFVLTPSTYGNCDNVSGHPMDRVCREVEQLLKEFPDRLTMVSTGGPVSGHDESDRKGWQANTKKLENAGVMGVEYSLSCPQGGDGTKGDIVSQDAELTAKIIGWVMEVGNPEIPKLFKLTAAVTAIYPIIQAIKAVFAKYPNKKAGVTLANSFPTMAFRKGEKKAWEEGVVLGMSGEGVIPISNLTLANVSGLGVTVSGNGGPMDYKSAADFLALGVQTVQFCTAVMKYGYGVVEDLHGGLGHVMQDRGYKSVKDLIGCALPHPIRGFMELSPKKKVSQVVKELCQHCGNCTRCPYQAISLDQELTPVTDASKCIGCSVCVQKCFAGALSLRDRTAEELSALKEA
jgi:dihydropyrimidine dehydrogenase (NAD+) subunit PreA